MKNKFVIAVGVALVGIILLVNYRNQGREQSHLVR